MRVICKSRGKRWASCYSAQSTKNVIEQNSHHGELNPMQHTLRTRINHVTRVSWLTLTTLLCLYVGFISQASSADYRQLFLMIMPLVLAQWVSVLFYVCSIKNWSRWFLLFICGLSLLFFAELGLRVALYHT